jgi:hypothetical protein
MSNENNNSQSQSANNQNQQSSSNSNNSTQTTPPPPQPKLPAESHNWRAIKSEVDLQIVRKALLDRDSSTKTTS